MSPKVEYDDEDDFLDLSELPIDAGSVSPSPSRDARMPAPEELPNLIPDSLYEHLSHDSHESFIRKDHPFFERCEKVFNSVKGELNLQRDCFEDMRDLACGDSSLPIILLQHPWKWRGKTSPEIPRNADAIHYIDTKLLNCMDLDLRHVVVIYLFPFLMEGSDPSLGRGQTVKIATLRKLFSITEDFLETFKPRLIVSCQDVCSSGGKFRYFKNSLARSLSSTQREAEKLKVEQFTLDDFDFHVVKAFQPGSFYQYGEKVLRPAKQVAWHRILEAVFRPCVSWHHVRLARKRELSSAPATPQATPNAKTSLPTMFVSQVSGRIAAGGSPSSGRSTRGRGRVPSSGSPFPRRLSSPSDNMEDDASQDASELHEQVSALRAKMEEMNTAIKQLQLSSPQGEELNPLSNNEGQRIKSEPPESRETLGALPMGHSTSPFDQSRWLSVSGIPQKQDASNAVHLRSSSWSSPGTQSSNLQSSREPMVHKNQSTGLSKAGKAPEMLFPKTKEHYQSSRRASFSVDEERKPQIETPEKTRPVSPFAKYWEDIALKEQDAAKAEAPASKDTWSNPNVKLFSIP